MLFGGVELVSQDHTWSFGAPAGAAAYGQGCGGPPVPTLTGGVPSLGARLHLDLLRARANAPAALGLSASMRQLSLGGGCTLYVGDPVLPLAMATDAAGFATWSVTVPMERQLIGARVFAQAFVVDAAGPVLGLAMSGGRRITVGH